MTRARQKAVRARLMWAARPDLADMFVVADKPEKLSAPTGPDFIHPLLVLPASPEDVERMVEIGAQAMDPIAFHTYKAGDCLPRGHEMDTVEHVNEIQGFRQRTALSKARKFLTALGLEKGRK